MKAIELTTMLHPQSGKQVKGIKILGKEFLYSDKRGFQTEAMIGKDFAAKVVTEFKPELSRHGNAIYMPERMNIDKLGLRWRYMRINSKECIQLLIHGTDHAYTSKPIEIN